MSSQAFAASFADAIARAGGLQARIMWCDAEANLQFLSNREGVADVVRRLKDAGINTIVVDVKPLSGYVLYNSSIAHHISKARGVYYPEDYDLLAAMVEECHKAGLKVHAAVNVFSEGSQKLRAGTAFDHPDWQCVNYETELWVRTVTGDAYPIAGTNVEATPGRLYYYPKDPVKGLNDPAKLRIALDKDGIATDILPPGKYCSVVLPVSASVLVASGQAAEWLSAHAAPGVKLTIDIQPRMVPVSISAAEHLAVFVNPVNRAVRDYELSVITEIVKKYDIDGIVLDRMRYPNIYADFSDLSRREFESFLGQKIERWPEDVYRITSIAGDIERGKSFKKWLEWRARTIKDFLSEVRASVKSAKPNTTLGVYVGSWYSDYYGVGVNWASPRHVPSYDWASDTYNEAGYADLVDYLCSGCYYPLATREEARAAGKSEAATVESAAKATIDVILDDTFVYPSLYLLDYSGRPEAFSKAMRAALASGQGIMLFDLVYVRNYDWWKLLKDAFAVPSKAPHDIPGLIDKVRETKRLVDKECAKQ